MHDANTDADRGALIDGRSEFTDAVRRSLAQACRQRERELCLVDTDFEVWPLDDAEVLDTLSAWASTTRLSGMPWQITSLTLVHRDFGKCR